MRIFLDTNIVLDTLIPGRPSEKASKQVVNLIGDDQLRFSISSITIANAAYSARKLYTKKQIRGLIEKVQRKLRVLELSAFNVYEAISSECPDFEDALQISIAEGDSDVIVTNNVKDFKGYTALEVLTPQEFLGRISAD